MSLLLCLIFFGLALGVCQAEVKTDVDDGRSGDESLKLDAFTPDGLGPFPVVICVHGGGSGSGDKATDITTWDKHRPGYETKIVTWLAQTLKR